MSLVVGDLVYVFQPAQTQHTPLTGKTGRIKHIKSSVGGEHIGVEFDENIGGHDLDGHCQKPFGYWMQAKDIQKMEPLATLLQKQWVKEWEPKLRKKEPTDSVILLE